MNLHNIVRGGITMVNPDTPATLLRSTGYTTGASSNLPLRACTAPVKAPRS